MNKKQGLFVAVLVLFAVWAPIYLITFNTRNDSVNACERANIGLRGPLFDFFKTAETARRDSAKESTGNERKINIKAARDYKKESTSMVEAVPTEIRINQNRPEVECEVAYPAPFPFG